MIEATRWFENLGSERDWNFVDQPNPYLKGRSMPLGMGKVLGGGSSINVMGWARGHKNDWDFFASESGETAWNYESVLNIYRRMEDWQGAPDPTREYFPDSSLQVDSILVSLDHVVSEWTLHTSVTEPSTGHCLERFESCCMECPSFGPRTGKLPNGPTTTMD